MSAHTNNVQVIRQNGIPAFAVIPYDDYLAMLPESIEPDSVPREVAEKAILEDMPLIKAWRLYLGMERGRTDFARAAVDYLAGIVGCTLVCDGEIHPDKETLADECLDDLPALAEFHTALREGQPLPVVRELCRKAKHDIDESLAIYEAQANSIENKRY